MPAVLLALALEGGEPFLSGVKRAVEHRQQLGHVPQQTRLAEHFLLEL